MANGIQLTQEIHLNSADEAIRLLGGSGEIRRRIQDEMAVRLVDRGTKVMILGDETQVTAATELLNELLISVRHGHTPSMEDVRYAIGESRKMNIEDLGQVLGRRSPGLRRDMQIKPRTRGQSLYLDSMRTHEITIAIGPAGTGKTYLAMAAAVSALLNRQVNRIILTRPAVEAGETLGFLPGDLQQKVNPYLRPLYDALYSMVDLEKAHRLFEREMIEVAPLAFMRGRTLSHCFAILDEGQNTTSEQMKMFLTRLGEGSRAVITGDVTQTDLPKGVTCGLTEAERILQATPGVAIIRLTRSDVVRHPLVQSIVQAYEDDEARRMGDPTSGNPGEAM